MPFPSLALAALAALVAQASPVARFPDSAPVPVIDGRWLTQGGESVIDIAPCGDAYCGTVSRVLKTVAGVATVDARNPDPAQRGNSLVGTRILSDMKFDGRAWRGRVYDPRSGRSYAATLRRAGADLDLEGCWGWFCRHQLWTPAT